jgi:multiple sugar transport system ATP-binding protein
MPRIIYNPPLIDKFLSLGGDMARVALENVTKEYPGGVIAARDVNLDIRDGEFVVLVGPSGCGKSTTLRMVAGLESITSGEVSIGDRVVNDVEPKDRDIAMVFQSYALYPHMSVRENMAFGLKLRKMSADEIDQRVSSAATTLGILELLERKPRALSGGQRQRVALGRALVRDPAVFLFDEPLSNLDAKMRVQMRTEISRLHHQLGATMIYVTHDQVEAMTMGERIVVMESGKVQQVDTPLNLYDRPVNKFVAGFIGSPAMNFLVGQLTRQDGLQFVTKSGSVPLPDSWEPPAGTMDRELVLGIRPEHIEVDDNGLWRLSVQVIEPLGNETLLYLSTGSEQITVRKLGNVDLKVDQETGLSIQPEHIRLFENNEAGTAID